MMMTNANEIGRAARLCMKAPVVEHRSVDLASGCALEPFTSVR